MKIVNILGGLGNQMFQYALALSLKEKFPSEEVLIDISCFNGYHLHNGFEIHKIFRNSLKEASHRDIVSVNYPLHHYRLWQIGKRIFPKKKTVIREISDMVFQPEVLTHTGSIYYDGYWQSEEYFINHRPVILNAFEFPNLNGINRKFVSELRGKTTCSIHVRRGDYLNHKLFKNLTDLDYYDRAIHFISKHTDIDCFVVFSNDIEWCRDNITPLIKNSNIEFVDWNYGTDSFRDMQLMSLCHHNIVANSSFSWWGAWLNDNPEKIVIAPHKWINVDYKTDIIPYSWIKL
jgi:hypothetical protein